MSVVSEEDVLAALLLESLLYAEGGTLRVPDDFALPPLVDAVVHELLCDWDLERAIADSERRLEIEQAERAVLAETERWGGSLGFPAPALYDALDQLARARAGAAGGGA